MPCDIHKNVHSACELCSAKNLKSASKRKLKTYLVDTSSTDDSGYTTNYRVEVKARNKKEAIKKVRLQKVI